MSALHPRRLRPQSADLRKRRTRGAPQAFFLKTFDATRVTSTAPPQSGHAVGTRRREGLSTCPGAGGSPADRSVRGPAVTAATSAGLPMGAACRRLARRASIELP